MNKARRKEIDAVILLLQEAQDKIEQAKSALEGPKDDERAAYDALPDSLKEGKEIAPDNLEEVHGELDDIDIGDWISKLEEAQQ